MEGEKVGVGEGRLEDVLSIGDTIAEGKTDPRSAHAKIPKRGRKELEAPTQKTFTKVKGSNPGEVRQQFLAHAMGVGGSGDGEIEEGKRGGKGGKGGGKLRPVKEVLAKLRYDGRFEVGEFVVGVSY